MRAHDALDAVAVHRAPDLSRHEDAEEKVRSQFFFDLNLEVGKEKFPGHIGTTFSKSGPSDVCGPFGVDGSKPCARPDCSSVF